jgi:hypothetical protein
MDAENKKIINQFEKIVNKIYEEKILSTKRTSAINKDDIVDLKIQINLHGDDSQAFIDSL